MKPPLVLLLFGFFFLSQNVKSQDIPYFQQGFIVTFDKDTIKGELYHDYYGKELCKAVLFKGDTEELVEYLAADIFAFGQVIFKHENHAEYQMYLSQENASSKEKEFRMHETLLLSDQ